MNSFEIRKKFFDFFEQNNHTYVKSSSLIPAQDPTLLFTNAGMNQFKDLFLSKEKRSYTRAVSIQKCIRAGGKHNDLENVGFTKRHLTFFEMMGNFSFSDYFKNEAINYAWDFLTKWLNLPKEKLYASVYHKDDESYEIWNKSIGLPDNRIYRLGEADNFWQMGDTGPCGPCSEIYIDRGNNFGCQESKCAPGCNCDRFLEIWNLVFMQYDRQVDGELKPLKSTGVDTGMGLERLCSIIQNKDSVYETDLFMPIINKIEELTRIEYNNSLDNIKAAFRVLADHLRSTSFAIADGTIPSNEGRGYVLRKIIRRAALFAQKLNSENIFVELVPTLVNHMSSIYPELEANKDLIIRTLNSEVDKFSNNLVQGQTILSKYISDKLNNNQEKVISGNQAFKLYDTYGFPLELTKVIAQDQGFSVDEEGFEKDMEEQRMRSGKKTEQCSLDQELYTQFTGYEEHITTSNIISIIVESPENILKETNEVKANTKCYIITDRSPFYVECGGQVSDQGFIEIAGKDVPLLALKKFGNAIAALIETPVNLKGGEVVTLKIDSTSRINTMKNHTATHLLQAALIEILGNQVKQAGSVVEPDYLRFDFTYHENVTQDQIKQVENLVNKKIMENIPLLIKHSTLKEAVSSGTIAFFEEKYNPEAVRVIEIPGFSKELCGGTHVKATGDIGVFKITQISSLASGVKRIVALTGPKALELFQDDFNTVKILSQEFKVPQDQVLNAIEKQKEQVKLLNQEIKDLKTKFYKSEIKKWSEQTENINSIPFLYLTLTNLDNTDLKNIATELIKLKPGFYFLNSKNNDKNIFLGMISDQFKSKINLKNLANWLKSKNIFGGAKDTLMQGGSTEKIDHSFVNELKNWINVNLE